MNFDLNEDHHDIIRAAKEYFAAETDNEHVRAVLDDDALPPRPGREGLLESGWSTMLLPESLDGAGASVLEAALVAEQGGYHLSSPSLATAARVALLADEDLAEALQSGTIAVLDGEFTVHDGRASGTSVPSLDALHGVTGYVFESGGTVYYSDDADRCRPTSAAALDPSRGLALVQLDDAQCRPLESADWDRARHVAQIIFAAENLGTLEALLDMSVAHAQERIAFGNPLGHFQAIKHQLVDIHLLVVQLRSLMWWAAWVADHRSEELAVAAASVKALASDALAGSSDVALHIFGGMGIAWETDIQLFYRRARTDAMVLGSANLLWTQIGKSLVERTDTTSDAFV